MLGRIQPHALYQRKAGHLLGLLEVPELEKYAATPVESQYFAGTWADSGLFENTVRAGEHDFGAGRITCIQFCQSGGMEQPREVWIEWVSLEKRLCAKIGRILVGARVQQRVYLGRGIFEAIGGGMYAMSGDRKHGHREQRVSHMFVEQTHRCLGFRGAWRTLDD